MSVDHDHSDFEFPETKPSEVARELAIFQAVAQFEDKQRQQGRAIRKPRGFRFGALLPRPGLRLALVSGAALLIAVPMGVQTIERMEPADTTRQQQVTISNPQATPDGNASKTPIETDTATVPDTSSVSKTPGTAQQVAQGARQPQTLMPPTTGDRAVKPDSAAAASPAKEEGQIEPLAAQGRNRDLPITKGVPAKEPRTITGLTVDRTLDAPSIAPNPADQTTFGGGAQSRFDARTRAEGDKYGVNIGTGQFSPYQTGPATSLGNDLPATGDASGTGITVPVPSFVWDPKSSGEIARPSGQATNKPPASSSDTVNLLASIQQFGGGFSATLSVEDGRSRSIGVEVGQRADMRANSPLAAPAQAGRSASAGQGRIWFDARTQTDYSKLSGNFQGRPIELPQVQPAEIIGRDKFANAPENAFKSVAQEPVSTFSIDVDTASYSYVRAALNQNLLPNPQAVRTEEMINYFPYDYTPPKSAAEPFSTAVTVMPNPWVSGHKLMRIGIKGYAVSAEDRPPANLVFLVDTSGSMNEPNKLPLLQKSLGMLVDTLRPQDKVAIVAYAGSAGVVLPPTAASDKGKILASLDNLQAGGSTAGGEGIRLAYQLAEANFEAKAVNRVMLATDGDFNVGITDPDELKGFVERERSQGIFLSVLGFGMGNLNDAMMQALAQNGNGTAAYIDTLNEARKVLVEEATTSLFPIAKDVKIQVEFNPAAVSDYRLIGYETRLLNTEDFNNDKVDAGEVGSGASVTAIYDFVPSGGQRPVDASRYQASAPPPATAAKADEYAFLKIRYKLPKSDTSTLISTPVTHAGEVAEMAQAPADARFAVAVAGFGEWLRGGKHTGSLTPDAIIALAKGAKGDDPFGYRAEFVNLVRAAKTAKGLPPE